MRRSPLPSITYEEYSIPKKKEFVEEPQPVRTAAFDYEELLQTSKEMTLACDSAIEKQTTPRDLRKDKQDIWNLVHAAEIQMAEVLGKAEFKSHEAVQRHGELCEAEASLLDIAGDYIDIATTGLEQQARAKKNSKKTMYIRKLEQGAATEHYLTVKPTWLTLAESTIHEINFLGYENATGWRSKADGFLVYMLQHFRREPFGGDKSVLKAKAGDPVVVSSSGTASANALELLRPTLNDPILILQVNPAQHPTTLRLCRKDSSSGGSKDFTESNTTSAKNTNGNDMTNNVFLLSDIERPAASFTRTIHRIRLILNTLAKTRVVEALEELCNQASDLEAEFNAPFQISRARVRAADTRLEEDKKAYQNITHAINNEITVAKDLLLRAFVEAQELLKQYREEELHTQTDQVGFLPALGVGDGYAGLSGTNSTPEFCVVARPNYIYYDLRACCRGGVEREQRSQAQNRFHRLLLNCSNAGSWQEALHVFAAMVHLGVPPTRETCHLVIRTCHRARPSQPALAIAMTRKMRALGIASTAKTFHLVIKACAEGGNHRMLSAAFRDLIASGHTPTTGTYDNILGLCENGCFPADEAPQLYESLRIAGVPEKIAFTCGRLALRKGKVTGRLSRGLNFQGSIS
jgi:hypothetical protein